MEYFSEFCCQNYHTAVDQATSITSKCIKFNVYLSV